NVRYPSEGVGKDKHRIALVHAIGQQAQGTKQAQPPKGIRHDDTLVFLCGQPLYEETREKNPVSEPADYFPEVPLDAEKLVVAPKQVREPIHNESILAQRRPRREVQRWRRRLLINAGASARC